MCVCSLGLGLSIFLFTGLWKCSLLAAVSFLLWVSAEYSEGYIFFNTVGNAGVFREFAFVLKLVQRIPLRSRVV